MSTTPTPGAMKAAAELFPHRHQMMLDEYATLIDRLAVEPAVQQLRAAIALRARVAEMEATIAELTTDANAATLAANLAAVSQRNAELVTALQDACAMSAGTLTTSQVLNLIARAESGTPDHLVDANKMPTPAKHPDTDWLATLLESALKSFAAMPEANPSHTRDGIWALWTDGCNALRAAIDAARKQGGAHD